MQTVSRDWMKSDLIFSFMLLSIFLIFWDGHILPLNSKN